MITKKELKKIYKYNRLTGIFTKIKTGCGAGEDADKARYVYITVNKKMYSAHRMVFVYLFGSIESDIEVDHINGTRSDNRLENLRLVTRQENQKNLKRSKSNKSGITGVYYLKDKNMWRATIYIKGKAKHFGTYKLKEDAIEARRAASKQFKFHENHGREL